MYERLKETRQNVTNRMNTAKKSHQYGQIWRKQLADRFLKIPVVGIIEIVLKRSQLVPSILLLLLINCHVSKHPQNHKMDGSQLDGTPDSGNETARADRTIRVPNHAADGSSRGPLSTTSCTEPCNSGEFCNQITNTCIPIEIEWIEIEGGEFTIGVKGGTSWELPAVQSVRLKAFKITRTEVTVSQYRKCVTDGGCTQPAWKDPYDNWKIPGHESHPINSVDWSQAKQFCVWIDAQLPSESQWEYAARSAGLDIPYPWGNQLATCEVAVMSETTTEHGCGIYRTWEVCSKPRGNTLQGLCDMAGNVWEWVEDDFHSSYDGIPDNGQSWIDNERGSSRIKRGGSFTSSSGVMRSSYRSIDDISNRSFNNGFRCVK